jgi:hypothetical protein
LSECNKEYPENRTVQIPNKKLPYAKISDGKGNWKVEKQKKVLDDMIVTIKNMMDEHVSEHEAEIRQHTYKVPRLFDTAKAFLDDIKAVVDEDRTVTKRQLQDYKKMVESLKCLVVNNTHVT